jgi:hypothetical protein
MSNARTKRLNESDKPVINFGIADDQHKLILPQNTTTNLAQITPQDVASLAYDTTLNEVVVNTGSGFTPVGAGGGVGSLNSLTGALSITAGTGITVTPSGSNIAIASTGANTALSNLSNPTAINTNLTFAGTSSVTTAVSGGNAFNLTMTPGQGTGGGSTAGALNLLGGAKVGGSHAAGAVNIIGGGATTNAGGVVDISGGPSVATGGTVNITSGSGNTSGDINIVISNAGSGFDAGTLNIQGGNSDTGSPTTTSLIAGNATAGTNNGANVNLIAGTSAGGQAGSIQMSGAFLQLPTGASDPTATAGSMYYNTGSNTIRWFNGTAWAALT